MSDAKEIASKLVTEVKDSAHLFFTPVRVIVTEFSKAVHQSSTTREAGSESEPPGDNKCGASAR
jgi:hypothetical protein